MQMLHLARHENIQLHVILCELFVYSEIIRKFAAENIII